MSTVIGISGSLRRGSFNTALLRAAAGLAPAGLTVEVASIREIPLYDGDVEAERGIPDAVSALKDRVAAADGLLLVTPEYNNSIPGVLKNAIDWASRPVRESALRFKPAAVVGATTGQFGAVWAQAELRKVLAAIGARVVEAEVAVGHAPTRFDEDGTLVDEDLREQLGEVVEALVSAVAERQELARTAA